MRTQQESDLIPYHAVKTVAIGKSIVFAPHPDDEVFGCGGAIIKQIEQGDTVKVIIVTDGGFPVHDNQNIPEYIEIRKEESRRAANILGYGIPQFLGYSDRSLEYNEVLITHLLELIKQVQPQNIYLPATSEIHPDHRILSKATTEAARRYKPNVNLIYNEIAQIQSANILLDITGSHDQLEAAMDCFSSQLAVIDYKHYLNALHTYRTFTLGKDVIYAEAYYIVNSKKMTKRSESWNQKCKMLSVPIQDNIAKQEFPLISVIVRTMNRPELSEALESLKLQTYPNIEIIVVDALGSGGLNLDNKCGEFPLHLINKNKPLPRAAAANAGLHAVEADYFCFLDEDDLLFPDHLVSLYELLKNSNSPAAYSNIKRVNNKNEFLNTFDSEFNFSELLWRNFIPIHAILYQADPVKAKCKFDDNFRIYEDWDYLIQASMLGDFIHLNKITGIYRDTNSSGIYNNKENIEKYKTLLFDKWRTILSTKNYRKFLNHLSTINLHKKKYYKNKYLEKQNETAVLSDSILEKNAIIVRRDASLAEKNNQLTESKNEIGMLNKHIALRDIEIMQLTKSLSWRITKPIRLFIIKKLRSRLSYYKNIKKIRDSGLFDEAYYLKHNEDVALSGKNPLKHYLLHGGVEGRNPGPNFNSLIYLERFPDVVSSGTNPLLHYAKYGKIEGRMDHTDNLVLKRNKFEDMDRSKREHKKDIVFISGCPGDSMRYRCNNQSEQLKYYNVDSDIFKFYEVNWSEIIYQYNIFILHRVPVSSQLRDAICVGKLIDKVFVFDTDDLIFDHKYGNKTSFLKYLPSHEVNSFYEGLARYNETLKLCSYAIGSTGQITKELQEFISSGNIFENRNVISNNLLSISSNALFKKQHLKDETSLVIGYLSGTKTHNLDFKQAEDALIKILSKFPTVKLCIIGILDISSKFDQFSDRINRIPLLPWQDLPYEIIKFDINIAPLEKCGFNLGKSDLKYFESALLKVPTVASDIEPYNKSIVEGVNGFLVKNSEEWYQKLALLIKEKQLRLNTGKNAFKDIIKTRTIQSSSGKLHSFITKILNNKDIVRKRSLNWILQAPIHGSGGYTNIFRIANLLAKLDYEVHFYIERLAHFKDLNDNEIIYFIHKNFNVGLIKLVIGHKNFTDAFATFATGWQTANLLPSISNAGIKLYFVQDFEAYFYEPGTEEYNLSLNTYNNKLQIITLGPYLSKKIALEFNRKEVNYIDFAADQDNYFIPPHQIASPIRIIFYARPETKRRGFEVGIHALKSINHKYRNLVEIVLYGCNNLRLYDIPFPFKDLGIISPNKLGEEFSKSHIGISLSLTNMSLVPFEMMSCNCAVIELDSDTTSEYLVDNFNCKLSKYDHDSIANTIGYLIDNTNIREELVLEGSEFVKKFFWEKGAEKIDKILSNTTFEQYN